MELRNAQAHARQQQLEINDRRRQNHVAVALALRDPARAQQVIDSAMPQVLLWKEKSLCSRDYIEAWQALLLEPLKAADLLETSSPFAVQMRQNSPFVSFIRQYDGSSSSRQQRQDISQIE